MTISQPTIDAQTTMFEELRRTEYARLDEGGHVYLDYTGGGLFAASQLREHMELLQRTVLGNPHSINPTSSMSTKLVERGRAAVLAFFNASPDEYVAILTPNATGALRLVGEAYPFHPGDRFLLTFDNHNSVNGIREFARAAPRRPTSPASRPTCASTRISSALPERDLGRPPQPVRVPRAVQRSAANCSKGWPRFATPTAHPRRRSTARDRGSGGARPSP